jgi:arylsulfatase A
MFSSDNGPHAEGGNDPYFNDSNGPLRGIKRDLYEGGIRVPFIVRWPGKIAPGSESGHISGFQDVMPTCAELAGAEAPAGIDGISFLPTLLGRLEQQQEHPYLYWEFYEEGGKQAVHMGKWKAVRLHVSENPDAPVELYDLSVDIGETHDVAGANPEIVERMRDIMKEAHTESDVFKLFPSEKN